MNSLKEIKEELLDVAEELSQDEIKEKGKEATEFIRKACHTFNSVGTQAEDLYVPLLDSQEYQDYVLNLCSDNLNAIEKAFGYLSPDAEASKRATIIYTCNKISKILKPHSDSNKKEYINSGIQQLSLFDEGKNHAIKVTEKQGTADYDEDELIEALEQAGLTQYVETKKCLVNTKNLMDNWKKGLLPTSVADKINRKPSTYSVSVGK